MCMNSHLNNLFDFSLEQTIRGQFPDAVKQGVNKMNTRERIVNILNYREVDHLPVIHFGYWRELLAEWAAQGHISVSEAENWSDGNPVCSAIAERLGFDCNFASGIGADNSLRPVFEKETVAVFPNGDRHVRNSSGVTELVVAGASSIPAEIDHLLTDRTSWEKHYKQRLSWSPDRLPADLPHCIRAWNALTDRPLVLAVGSVIGVVRNWLGIVNLSYLQIDDPDLLEEIIFTCSELALRNAKILFEAGLRPDFLHWWEDICYNHGPLVTPEFFAECCVPHYQKMTELARGYNCTLASIDCDGKIDELIPHWLRGGVNLMFPIEIGTWNPDFSIWRKQYGRELRGIGGMNKNVFSLDRSAVDAEIERLRPWIELGGFIPCPDHRLPPGTKWELVQYYTDRLHSIF